jgi:2,3-bisphosphoglycerate-independent phosphoglycerate mutase
MDNQRKIASVTLLLIDGWGVAPAGEGNAISQAAIPNFKELVSQYPATILRAGLSRVAGKKVSVANNYSALGTSRIRLSRGGVGLFDVLEKAGKNYFVITEAEKFAYSTYFFSGRKKIKKTDYLLVSPGEADDYFSQSKTGVLKITEALLKSIKSGNQSFILADFASLDLVAHRGDFVSTVKTAEIIDQSLKKIVKAVLENSGILLITAPNGNAEELIEMKTETKNIGDTANPVPFLMIGRQFEGKTFGWQEVLEGDLALTSPSGSILDVAPTILKIMGLESPLGFNGKSLI